MVSFGRGVTRVAGGAVTRARAGLVVVDGVGVVPAVVVGVLVVVEVLDAAEASKDAPGLLPPHAAVASRRHRPSPRTRKGVPRSRTAAGSLTRWPTPPTGPCWCCTRCA